MQILTCFFSVFFFKKKQWFHWRKQPTEKVVITEEELDDIDINDIGILENSPRLLFIDEECGNLKVVNDGGELTRNITIRRSQTFYNSL